MFKKINSRKKKGFTLVEMVMVLFIIAMLMLLILPNLSQQKDNATKKSNEAFRTTIQTQVDLTYKPGDAKLEKLESDGVISSKQKERADKMKMKITDGKVVLPEDKVTNPA
ncbi:competence type IV pilus major pilin ComGC [Companilactobacillus mishanensis]|uniref:competence type IV pilus major pilin ComGC n=1 Tax=Companilactobacillus mishanensis TaxID=2486008 RepID=UPI0012951552|nr:competence type IV pilus major pilin ComGC [Companilactobacillus mishanensis]MQS88921.1 prepilin-type N-terminal cleavage/methylation domain-containing protein [Companilactobacillus mishanensis]